MRVFGRILYSLFAVGLFLLAFTYSRDLMMTKYIEDVFGASLTDENFEHPKFYYFYTSIPDFHNSEPIIEINQNGYELMGYEVALVSVNNNNELVVSTYLYMLVYSETKDLSILDYISFNKNGEEVTQVNLQRFKTLNLVNAINDAQNIYIEIETFTDNKVDQISLVDKAGSVLLTDDLSIENGSLIINDFMSGFYNQNSRIPSIDDIEDLSQANIFPNQTHVAEDYVHIFYIAMGSYFVIITLATYFIYFKKKKKRYS